MFHITHIEFDHGHRGIHFIGNQDANDYLYKQNVKNERVEMKGECCTVYTAHGVHLSIMLITVECICAIISWNSHLSPASCTHNINHTKWHNVISIDSQNDARWKIATVISIILNGFFPINPILGGHGSRFCLSTHETIKKKSSFLTWIE